MPLPFEPQPLETLRGRYPAALEFVHDNESIGIGVAATPGKSRRHVFDCEDGLRLIISRHVLRSGHRRLHVAASLHAGTALFAEVLDLATRDGPAALLRGFPLRAWERFRELTGRGELMPTYLIYGLVPHWVLPDEESHDHAE